MHPMPGAASDEAIAESAIVLAGTAERFRKLQRWFSYYDCLQHNHKKVDWDGSVAPGDELEKYQLEMTGAGTGSDAGEGVPLARRRPTTPFHVARVVVETFTDLLFDEDRAPKIIIKKSKEDQDWYRSLVEVTNWWERWTVCRDYGGGSGSAAIAFHFDSGTPKIEVIDARHATPSFKNSKNHESLEKITIQYVYEVDEIVVKQAPGGKPFRTTETVYRWYRRVIDATSDVVYSNPEYEADKVPDFTEAKRIDHGLGFVPAVWIDNLPGVDDIDGYPDFYGATQLFDTIDLLLSQCTKGGAYNVDPTLHIGTDREVKDIKGGSFNAVQTEAAGKLSLVEFDGEGIKVVLSQVEQLRQYALLICRCVLDRPQANDRDRVTATEIQKAEMSMFARANRLRRRWGRAIKRLLILIGRAARHYNGKNFTVIEDGIAKVYQYAIVMPDGVAAAPSTENPVIELRWGRYIHISPADLKALIEALAAARLSKILDLESCVEMLVQYLPYKDPEEIVKILMEEIEKELAELGQDDKPAADNA